jgi:phosphate-selective porin OprO/OprP
MGNSRSRLRWALLIAILVPECMGFQNPQAQETAPTAAATTPPPPHAPPTATEGSAPAPQPEKSGILLQAIWDNGLRFESENKQFNLHIGGAAQIDTVWLIGPQSVFALPGGGSNGIGNAEATQIRRAILQADGGIYEQFDYSVQFDFANASNDNSGLEPPSFGNLTSSPAPLNVWVQMRDVPYLGVVRVGNQDKPIGMEKNTPNTLQPFMERSDSQDAFYGPFNNGFALGISAHDWTESERITWRYGVFQPATNVFGVALSQYEAGARVTALPWYEDDGQYLIHLGLGYLGGEIVQDELRVRARTLLRNGPGFAVPILADTGELSSGKQYTVAPEFAMVLGPITVQAEYTTQFVTSVVAPNGRNVGNVLYQGGYAEVLYFLTGEHQNYVRRDGVFGRVEPLHDFHWKKSESGPGTGAWQVGVRFSYLNLNDNGIQGGQLYDWTVGLNWFLNPNIKVQLNYIAEHRDVPGVPEGWINGVGMRAAFSF